MSLQAADRPLNELHDAMLLDLDGVVYIGPEAVPAAPEAVGKARAAGARVAFVTNNAGRTPARIAEHLTQLGVPAAPEDVVTSAEAAARLIAAELLGHKASFADLVRPGRLSPIKGGKSILEENVLVVKQLVKDYLTKPQNEKLSELKAGDSAIVARCIAAPPSSIRLKFGSRPSMARGQM